MKFIKKKYIIIQNSISHLIMSSVCRNEISISMKWYRCALNKCFHSQYCQCLPITTKYVDHS